MNIAKGCTVIFDKGYCNYAVFGDFCRDKIFFVTRLKENAQYRVKRVIEELLTTGEKVSSHNERLLFGLLSSRLFRYERLFYGNS